MTRETLTVAHGPNLSELQANRAALQPFLLDVWKRRVSAPSGDFRLGLLAVAIRVVVQRLEEEAATTRSKVARELLKTARWERNEIGRARRLDTAIEIARKAAEHV